MLSLEENFFWHLCFFFSREPKITIQYADIKHGYTWIHGYMDIHGCTNQPSNNHEIPHIGMGVKEIKLELDKQARLVTTGNWIGGERVLPENTEEPIWMRLSRARATLSFSVLRVKARTRCEQNSTPIPTVITRFTTDTWTKGGGVEGTRWGTRYSWCDGIIGHSASKWEERMKMGRGVLDGAARYARSAFWSMDQSSAV